MKWRALFKPSTKYSIFTLLVVGIIVGVVGYFATQKTLHVTSNDDFCMTCHSNHSLKKELMASVHGSGSSGITLACQDCHLPHDPFKYLIKKIIVSKDVYGYLTIDNFNTQSWLDKNRKQQASIALKYFHDNDSANCRHCHTRIYQNQPESMKKIAKKVHSRNFAKQIDKRKTCVDCHHGMAHLYPRD